MVRSGVDAADSGGMLPRVDAGCQPSIGLQPQSHVQCMTIKTMPVHKHHNWALQMWIKFVRTVCRMKARTRRAGQRTKKAGRAVPHKIQLCEETEGVDDEQKKQARERRPLGRIKTLASSGEESAGSGQPHESIGLPQYMGYTLEGIYWAFHLPLGCKP